jgi:AcrR family transcriptional regulator
VSVNAIALADHRARRRRDVVDNATELLVRGGPAAVTPAAVATATGLASHSVSRFFETTDELIAAAVEELFIRDLTSITLSINAAGTNPVAQLEAYVRTVIAAAVKGHLHGNLTAMEVLPPNHQERLMDLHEELNRPLVLIVQRLESTDPECDSAMVLGVISSASQLVLAGEPKEHVVARTMKFLRGALSV